VEAVSGHPAGDVEGSTPIAKGAGLAKIAVSLAGFSFLAYAIQLSAISIAIERHSLSEDRALVWLAASGAAAGALYLAGLSIAGRFPPKLQFLQIVAVAALARLVVSSSAPMLESDYQRYLWDGAVTAHAINPYRHSPGEVLEQSIEGPEAERLIALSARAGPVLERTNHPSLTTIYPPIAQFAFAAAHVLDPFGVNGLRVVYLLADFATILIIAQSLRALSLPSSWLAIYAWNPILLREVYSALHMDILLLPLLAGAVLAGVRKRGWLGAALLVIASAVKVWPIVLVPLLLTCSARSWAGLGRSVVALTILAMAVWLPVLMVSHGDTSGFVAYGRGWQNNDGFFRLGIWLTESTLTALRLAPWHSHTIMRVLAAALIGAVVVYQLWRRREDAASLPTSCLVVVGAVFLLSPTQFPWYWLWCLPLLALRPFAPLLLYAVLLPTYYVQDQFPYPTSHWLQHAPVWAMLALAARRAGGRRAFAAGRSRAMEVRRA